MPGIHVFHAETPGQAALPANAVRAHSLQFYSNCFCLIHAEASLIELLC
jgi:hypothetical protein